MHPVYYCDDCDQPIIGTIFTRGEVELCYGCYCDNAGDPYNPPKDRQKIESDGLSTSYYSIPAHATELRHLISHKGMSKSRGDIFKACYRLGEKAGTDVMYDLNKMKFFIEDLIEMHQRGEHL
jgi:hypothetical protein